MVRDNLKVFLIVFMLFVVSFSLILSTENPSFADEFSPAESISAPNWNYSIETISSSALSDDGEYFVAGSENLGTVYLFEKESDSLVWSSNLSYYTGIDVSISSVDISANGDYLVAGTENEGIFLFSRESSTPLWNFSSGTQGSYLNHNVAMSASGDYIAVGLYTDAGHGGLFLFSKESNVPLWHNNEFGSVSSVIISDDGEYIVASNRVRVALFSQESNVSEWTTEGSGPSFIGHVNWKPHALSISSDNSVIATTCYARGICLYDTTGNMPLESYNSSDSDLIDTLSLSPNGEYLIAGWFNSSKKSGTFMLFDTDGLNPINSFSSAAGDPESYCSFCSTVEVSNTGQSMVSDYSTISFFDHNFESPLAQYNWTNHSTQYARGWYDADISFESMNVIIEGTDTIYSFSIGDNYPDGDAWLKLDLLSWTANSSETWDDDDGLPDPQFRVCINADNIELGCTNSPTWDNTLNLTNAWTITEDIPDGTQMLNISIECEDNDVLNDDECDMNSEVDEWKLYFEGNWRSIITTEFSGNGSLDDDSNWKNAATSWMLSIGEYGDADEDGVYDGVDECPEVIAVEYRIGVDEFGCAWTQYDWDKDSISNLMDPCPQLITDYCRTEGQYVRNTWGSPTDYEEFYDYDISFDGNLIAIHSSKGLFMHNKEGDIIHDFSLGNAPSTSKLSFNQNGSMFFMLTEGMLRVYDASDYSILYQNGNDNRCDQSPYMAFTQNGEKMIFQAPCQSYEIIEVNLQTWESSTYAQPGEGDWYRTDAIYNPNGDYYYSGVVEGGWRDIGRLLKVDGTSIWSGADKLEIYEKDRPSHLDILQTIPIENLSGFWPVGDQRSILLIINKNGDYDSNQDSAFEIKIYDTISGNIDSVGLIEGHQLVYARISEDGSTIFVLGLGYPGAPKAIEGYYVFERDRDSDNFVDSEDLCPEIVGDFSGCLEEMFDTDEDGINDRDDQCPETTEGTNVDAIGCALNQLDSDGDGISDATDQCPNTPAGDSVGLTGCSGSQVDSDGDGIYDSQDNCPSTPSSTTVDSTGCAPNDVVDLDSDGDGVRDSIDTCPNSATGIIVDSTGCETGGDVQELDDEVSSEDLSDAFVGLIGLLVVVGIIAAVVAGIKSLTSSSNDSYDWDYGSYSSVSSHTNPTPQPEPNLELQNVVAELERQRMQSEREMNQLRQQQAQQSSASEIAAMQREMQALQQRVADSEQAKLQLQNEIEQVKIQKDESINMQDSVVGGDMVASGGQKIESQTNVMGTDPEAIARIIFEAQEKERERMRKERND